MRFLDSIRARWHAFQPRNQKIYTYVGIIVALILFIPIYYLFLPPAGFPTGTLISIPADSTSEEIAIQLASQHVVRSGFQFNVFTRLTGQDRTLQSGIYLFDRPLGLWSIATHIADGDHGITETRVTLTEGMTTEEMAQTLAKDMPGFDGGAFLRAASTSQGYLFPDTYFILPGTTPEDLVKRFSDEFDARIKTIQPQITAFGKPLRDDVILASILEREAKGKTDQQMVAGILYNRLRLGMPLQVDAAANTYRFKGLPPSPIANPGLAAILAAINPTKTDYLYYLTGKDGTMHYAKTFEQHKANIVKYL